MFFPFPSMTYVWDGVVLLETVVAGIEVSDSVLNRSEIEVSRSV
jgi:hypothetical protein